MLSPEAVESLMRATNKFINHRESRCCLNAGGARSPRINKKEKNL